MTDPEALLPIVAQAEIAETWRPPAPFRLVGPEHRRPAGLIAADDRGYRRLATQCASPFARALPVLGLDRGMRCADRFGESANDLRPLEAACRRTLALPYDSDAAIPHLDLLAYLLVNGAALSPTLDFASPDLLAYDIESRFPDALEAAEALVGHGYLARRHLETVNLCPDCRSARLLVRDQCGACGSSDISEAAVIHHFVCAHQASEDTFRQGEALVCPKCRQMLRHPSVDYEQSTTICRCEACGQAASEPVAGYRCLDCDGRGLAARLAERTLSSYALTTKARRLLREPAEGAGASREPAQSHAAAG